MTDITEGMTPTEFVNAINNNFDLMDFAHTAITTSTNLQTNLNSYFSKSDNYVGIKGSDYAVLINSNFSTKWYSVYDTAFITNLSDAAVGSNNQPCAIYRSGKTYITFQSLDDDPYIITYIHATDTWSAPVKVGTNSLGNGDGHGEPMMFFDSLGYIHVLYGGHGEEIQHGKSDNPEDISAWTDQTSPVSGGYIQTVQFSDGTIWLFFRVTGGLWGYTQSTDNGATWSEYVNLIGGVSYITVKKGIGDTIHIVIYGVPPTTDITRYNIYYLQYSGGSWKTITGASYSYGVTPLTDILVYNSGINYNPRVAITIDSSNNPYLLFTEGTGEIGTYGHYFAKYNGSAWVLYDMGVSTDFWRDFPTALDCISSSHFDAYIVTGGTADTKGGNIEKWSSLDGGAIWSKIATLTTGHQFLDPIMVENYNAHAKVFFAEYKGNGDYTNWGCLYGDDGFVGKRIDN